MWRKIVFTIAIIMLAAGIALVAFPPVSNFVGTQISKGQTSKFDQLVENVIENESFEEAKKHGEVDDEAYPIDKSGNRTSDTQLFFRPDLDRLLKDSQACNERLKTKQGSLLVSEDAYAYPELNLADYGIFDGIYGYVFVPSIDMSLPVYLGANGVNMSYGAAHMTYTSLPIGGEGTNCVLAGHSGYIGRIFFDNIRALSTGDNVYFRNYWETLTYKVTETRVYRPNESQGIFIRNDKDLLTLFTCVPDGKGDFDRYFVVCERS